MPEVTSYAPGTPAWVDLMTSDPEGAKAFYGALFDWEFEVGPAETGHYTLCQLRGLNVVGLNGMTAPDGVPIAWTTYLATDDVRAVAQRVTAAGGTVTVEPMAVMELGHMAVATDPGGAVFGLWQAGQFIGASLVNEPGAVVWNELATRDLAPATEFYTAVFGYDWQVEDTGEGGPPYQTFKVGDRQVGGALQMTAEWPEHIPAHWMPYFQVSDIDQAVKQTEQLGGTVRVPRTDSPYGPFAVLGDPQGAVFTAIGPAPQ